MKIREKVFLSNLFTIIILSVTILGTLYLTLHKYSENRLKQYRKELMTEKVIYLKDLTNSVYTLIKKYYDEFQQDLRNGKARTTDEKFYQKRALSAVDAIRFGTNGYFYTYTYEGVNIQHAINKKLIGKNLFNFKDNNGVLLIQELITQAKKEGGGPVDFIWPNPVTKKSEPKLGYAMGFQPWNWMFGTGIYYNDVKEKLIGFKKEIMNELTRGMLLVLLLVGLISIISFIIVRLFLKDVGQSLIQAEETFRVVSQELDLSIRIHSDKKDEIASVLNCYDHLAETIEKTLIETTDIALTLSSSAEEFKSSAASFSNNAQDQNYAAEIITATIEEMSAGITGIAQGAETQFERLKNLIEGMRKLSNLIDNVSLETTQAKNLTDQITQEARDGEGTLMVMKDSMEKISNSSGDVTNIISIINDISAQINLLSLNAAIEAARAGEAGKGFAVVADEISRLADQTANSIKNIDTIITQNEREIMRGKNIVEDTVALINSIIGRISIINQMMDNISNSILQQKESNRMVNEDMKEIHARAEEVKTSTEEQRVASEEIDKAIGKINELTQQNASGSEEVAASADSMSTLAEELISKISQFKTGGISKIN